MKILSRGEIHLYSVTIPEGLNIRETAEIFERKGITDKNKFISIASDKEFISTLDIPNVGTLEGFLFPNTYFFRKNENEKTVVTKMVDT